jgi:2'-5' RNA ligase
MRLFAAIELPADVREAALEAQGGLRAMVSGVRWVRAENLHLTLAFFGEVDRHDRLVGALGEGPPLARVGGLTLRSIGGFPERRPRVIVIDVEDVSGKLGVLAGEIGKRAEAWRADDKPFRAHVTLGRSKDSCGIAHRDLPPVPVRPAAWEPEEFVLFESQRTATGSIYRAIARFPLA